MQGVRMNDVSADAHHAQSHHTKQTKAIPHKNTRLLRFGEEPLEIKLRLLAPRQSNAGVDVVESRRAECHSRQFFGKLHLGAEIVHLLLLKVDFFLVGFFFFHILEHLARQ